jgi:hypothetical protein
MEERQPAGTSIEDYHGLPSLELRYKDIFGPTKEVEINRHPYEVYDTTEFRKVYGYYISAMRSREPRNDQEIAYRKLLQQQHVKDILEELATTDLELATKLHELNDKREEELAQDQRMREGNLQHLQHPREQAVAELNAKSDYYFSKALDIYTDIATTNYPGYDLSFLH